MIKFISFDYFKLLRKMIKKIIIKKKNKNTQAVFFRILSILFDMGNNHFIIKIIFRKYI
jgi:hypothetical protein